MLHPYQNKWAMLLMGPISSVMTRMAMRLDTLSKTNAAAKHALGWTLLLEKPKP
jgi:hypothetical protein